jgi:murein DD-endopeptidase MepM/ murein hydrolase activator NlpD
MRHPSAILLFGVASLAVLVALAGLGALAVLGGAEGTAAAACAPTVAAGALPSLEQDQTNNAATIATVSQSLQLPRRAAVIAVAVAMQESSLRNLDHGDTAGPDSRGLFQQRLSVYTTIDPMVPAQATTAFLTRLVAVPSWQTRALDDDAFQVQRFKDDAVHHAAYAAKEPAAIAIVETLWPDTPGSDSLPSASANCGPGANGGTGTWKLPVDVTWWQAHPDWFAKPHHDYPAADIPVPAGTIVLAVTAGTITAAPVGGTCGQGVSMRDNGGDELTYCHGSSDLVPAGAVVAAGDPIMVSGFTGHVIPAGPAGAHVHLQIRTPDGQLRCPQNALAAWAQGQTVALPSLPTTGCTN